jgi:hypothetical protein
MNRGDRCNQDRGAKWDDILRFRKAEVAAHESMPKCRSCGVAFDDHRGVEGTCAELQRVEVKAARLLRVLRKMPYLTIIKQVRGPDYLRKLNKAGAELRQTLKGLK